jgi:Helix-turn-helix domain
MSGSGDRLHDVRQRPTFDIEKAALAYIPRIGPAAWAVYCYLISLASGGDSRWPDLLTVASACGVSTYNAQLSIDSLISVGLISRHTWTEDQFGPSSFAVLPAGSRSRQEPPLRVVVPQPRGTDLLVSEDTADEESWRAETDERDHARRLFSRMLESLDVDPGDLSERARATATEASRLARAVGATPDDVSNMIDRIRDSRPDMVDDAERILEYWSDLFADMSDESNDDSESNE